MKWTANLRAAYPLACLETRTPDLEALHAGATTVMKEMTFYSNTASVRLERYVVLARGPAGLFLVERGRLPAYDDAVSAVGAAEARGDGARALVALRSVWWHTHM